MYAVEIPDAEPGTLKEQMETESALTHSEQLMGWPREEVEARARVIRMLAEELKWKRPRRYKYAPSATAAHPYRPPFLRRVQRFAPRPRRE